MQKYLFTENTDFVFLVYPDLLFATAEGYKQQQIGYKPAITIYSRLRNHMILIFLPGLNTVESQIPMVCFYNQHLYALLVSKLLIYTFLKITNFFETASKLIHLMLIH